MTMHTCTCVNDLKLLMVFAYKERLGNKNMIPFHRIFNATDSFQEDIIHCKRNFYACIIGIKDTWAFCRCLFPTGLLISVPCIDLMNELHI